ncbi:hypothetical protein [Vallitalea guaymasensis]|nr:hypothetical protein [Vallitalea guaymasensis]
MAKRKYKKLTARQKKFNAEVKKEMIEKGLLPPPKPRLNRRKFACEVRKELEDFSILGDGAVYMAKAIYNMLPDPDSKMK